MGGIAKDHGAPQPVQLPGPETAVAQRQRVAKERTAQRVRSWTGQKEMKSVLGGVSAAAAERLCLLQCR